MENFYYSSEEFYSLYRKFNLRGKNTIQANSYHVRWTHLTYLMYHWLLALGFNSRGDKYKLSEISMTARI